MTELLTSLIQANNIITSVYSQWDEAAKLQAQARMAHKNAKKNLTMKTALFTGVFLFAAWFVSSLLQIAGMNIVDDMNAFPIFFLIKWAIVAAVTGVCYALIVHPRVSKENKKIQETFNAAMARANAVYQAGMDHARANLADVAFLPNEYRYPLATGYLVNCVQQRRAATLQEALDKFDEQLHRWKLEASQQQILRQQRIQSQQLNNINTSINVNTAVTAAGFAANIITRL